MALMACMLFGYGVGYHVYAVVVAVRGRRAALEPQFPRHKEKPTCMPALKEQIPGFERRLWLEDLRGFRRASWGRSVSWFFQKPIGTLTRQEILASLGNFRWGRGHN